MKSGSHRAGILLFSIPLLCFFIHRNPNLTLIIRVGSVLGRINLKLYILGIFVLCALREKLRYNSVIWQ